MDRTQQIGITDSLTIEGAGSCGPYPPTVRPENTGGFDMIGTISTTKKIKFEQAFPGRFDWLCSVCGEWNRYFEGKCPYCEEKEHV